MKQLKVEKEVSSFIGCVIRRMAIKIISRCAIFELPVHTFSFCVFIFGLNRFPLLLLQFFLTKAKKESGSSLEIRMIIVISLENCLGGKTHE